MNASDLSVGDALKLREGVARIMESVTVEGTTTLTLRHGVDNGTRKGEYVTLTVADSDTVGVDLPEMVGHYPFTCECGQMAKTERGMATHREKAHGVARPEPEGVGDDYPFTCLLCGKRAKTERGATVHAEKAHGVSFAEAFIGDGPVPEGVTISAEGAGMLEVLCACQGETVWVPAEMVAEGAWVSHGSEECDAIAKANA